MASEELAFEAQIKRLYAVLHSLGKDPKEWKKEHNISSYAKLTRKQCSELIDELEKQEEQFKEEFGEEDKKQGAKVIDAEPAAVAGDKEGAIKTGVQKQITKGATVIDAERGEQYADLQLEEAHAQAEIFRMGLVMKFCTIEAKKIADELCNAGVTEGTKAGMIQKLATTMFIEAMRRGL